MHVCTHSGADDKRATLSTEHDVVRVEESFLFYFKSLRLKGGGRGDALLSLGNQLCESAAVNIACFVAEGGMGGGALAKP